MFRRVPFCELKHTSVMHHVQAFRVLRWTVRHRRLGFMRAVTSQYSPSDIETLMITLRDTATGATIGTLTEDELAALVASLEEESRTDQDYYINLDTIELLRLDGAPSSLTDMLRNAMNGREGMDIEWVRE